MSFCKRRCKGTAIFSNHQIIPYYIIYFFVGLYVSSNIFSKTSCLGGRLSDYRNHSKNSLRSNSFSCRFACLAYATQESKKIPIIVHPLKTSSCGVFSRIHSRNMKHEVR